MSDTPNIFEDKKPEGATTPETPAEPTPNAFDQLLSGIQRDDGTPKYSDVPTALNALKESQNYIAQLKQEVETLQAKATEGATMEKVLEALKPEVKPVEETPTPTSLTLEDVESFMARREMETATARNEQMVSNRCIEVFGAEASTKLAAKAAEVGVTPDILKKLAGSSPTAVFKLLGIDKASPSPSLHTSVNTATLNGEPQVEIKPVMGNSTDNQLLDSWNAIKAEVNKELNIEGN